MTKKDPFTNVRIDQPTYIKLQAQAKRLKVKSLTKFINGLLIKHL